ncbi:MAG: hypothetical protein WD604_03460 [Balneolaceae bacterium]
MKQPSDGFRIEEMMHTLPHANAAWYSPCLPELCQRLPFGAAQAGLSSGALAQAGLSSGALAQAGLSSGALAQAGSRGEFNAFNS